MGAVIVALGILVFVLVLAVFFCGPFAVELFDDTIEEWRDMLEERKAKKEKRDETDRR